MTALASSPPAAARTSAMLTPRGNSYTPGRVTSPEMLSSFGPVDRSVPMAANQSAPLARIAAAQARVSTLFTVVGAPCRPLITGNGGRLRGSPRRPSRLSISAVSSPQTYAPEPRWTWMSKVKSGRPRMPVPGCPASGKALLQVSQQVDVLAAQVEDPLGGPDRVPGDGHALEDQVGQLVEQHSVLERPRFALVRVADDVATAVRSGGGRRY